MAAAAACLEAMGWRRKINIEGLVNPQEWQGHGVALDLCGYIPDPATGKVLGGFWFESPEHPWSRITEVCALDLRLTPSSHGDVWQLTNPEAILVPLYGEHWRVTPPKRILSTGVFDLFHIGHLRYLQYARRQGSHLTVAVTPDALCAERKGKWPVIDETQRLEIIRGLGWVDHAAYMPGSLEQTDLAAAWISEWGIDHVVVGGEWEGTPRWQRLTPVLAEQGIAVSFAPHTQGISSTEIVKR